MTDHAVERVAICVVSYNSADQLPGLLASLPAGASGVAWHLVVADNASSDDSVATVRRLAPEATLVQLGRNAGYAAGVNAALAAAAPYTAALVLNPDVRLEPGCLATLVTALRAPGVGIAVPRLIDAAGKLILSQRREPTLARAFADALVGAERAGRTVRFGEVVSDPARYQGEADLDWAEGSTQLISAECLRSCGPWDESFFLYSEETDFDLRAGDHGFAVRYVPAARAVHLEGGSGQTPALWSLLVLNRVRLFRRRNGLPRAVLFWLAILLREASRAVLGRRTSRAAVRRLIDPRSVPRMLGEV
ncbi:glycosyltransferase family 2 protein [Microlunatus parietis]|uniref:GT2 family glycosyltransferase n=1 Tax=Microlunatus parietis TaxID=682979 RepID=A0A7Y9LEG3_9ACTN|nr:glycosyltransferase family 2 protein [Microlunatus parietis]NYE73021.1 GT2 family glycosyltransferase [Microlunatus parietis]